MNNLLIKPKSGIFRQLKKYLSNRYDMPVQIQNIRQQLRKNEQEIELADKCLHCASKENRKI